MKLFLSAAAAALMSPLLLAQQPALQVDWKQSPINGHWYGVDYTPRTWTDSEALAVSLGGHLATIRSQGEQDWIMQLVAPYCSARGSNAWIGYSDSSVEGVWNWADGAPTTYTNWGSGEPNGGTTENWAHLNVVSGTIGAWNDTIIQALVLATIETAGPVSTGWSWPQVVSTGVNPLYGVIADLDGDGDNDYASPNSYSYPGGSGDSVAIFWNDGSGTLSPGPVIPVSAEPRRVVATDADSDGDLDLVVSCRFSSLQLLRQNSGTFTLEDLDTGRDFYGLQLADLNSDSHPDLISADHTGNKLVVYPGSTTGFGPSSEIACPGAPLHLTVLDYNLDGALDVAVTCQNDNKVRVFANDGLGSLSQPAIELALTFPTGIAATDLNQDGAPDLAASTHSTTEIVAFLNDNNGGFQLHQALPLGSLGYFVLAADLDGDQNDEILVTTGSSGLKVFRASPTGDLVPSEVFLGNSSTRGMAVGDLDGDSSPDLIAAPVGASELHIWKNHRVFDCNQNGVPDLDDITAGTSLDCNANGIPDECDALQPTLDCDQNGLIDSCELSPATDCDGNGLIDLCELLAGTMVDCNLNNLPDACDIAADPFLDCDGNGVIDACGEPFPDCNQNGVRDTCEVLAGTAADCDGDGTLDSCQLAADPALDCDGNGLLDGCEIAADPGLDADGSGVLDFCECSQFDSYCQTNPNSFSAEGARIGSSGLASVSANAFQLTVSQAPPGRPGIFFYSANQANAPFGDGTRCVASPIYRLQPPGLIGGAGNLTRHLDLTVGPPAAGGGAITAGSTWNFQFWYRDPQGGPNGFNLSDGLEVVFCP